MCVSVILFVQYTYQHGPREDVFYLSHPWLPRPRLARLGLSLASMYYIRTVSMYYYYCMYRPRSIGCFPAGLYCHLFYVLVRAKAAW